MRWMISLLSLTACSLLFASNTINFMPMAKNDERPFSDSVNNDPTFAAFVSDFKRSNYYLVDLELIIQEKQATEFRLGKSSQGRKIPAYYIPGTSNHRALVIGGVHGSELSSVEVAYNLLSMLRKGKTPYYSVVIIPSLFPDNAMRAMQMPDQIGSVSNIGRYTFSEAVDPNRQMPTPGKPYDEETRRDHVGRIIEQENQLLLELIQVFKPQRVANLHAIRDMGYGGVYADPRTDHRGIALGYTSDSSLAVDIAMMIHRSGGNVYGNRLSKHPTALYYKDPTPVAPGQLQKRNMTGTVLVAKRGSGVSLGTWGSTAVVDESNPSNNRDAMRILTFEYPGYKRPQDYKTPAQQLLQQKQVGLFAEAIAKIFLGDYYAEAVSGHR
ncbi:MAG: hypothetical protein H7Y42_18160 [Chitinophagaceae bacterium]|nr:hypothetical protein [Chitinophagaceae bacterium]